MKLDCEKLYPWLAILRAKFMGSGRAVALAKHFGSIEKALQASPDTIAEIPRFNIEMGRSVREAAQGKFDQDIDKELKWAEKDGVQIFLMSDPEFPIPLRHIPWPPALLYVKGKLLPEDILSFGIVGSRRASDRGKRMSNQIACELAEAGITITSGLAWGVDASAHKGALKCKQGRTIAVMGNGLGMIYPKEHKNLADQIVTRGALVTELFHDVSPQAQNFPPRNRIISGLSLGVLVVEAPARSGSLITANYALEQGREVFAMPGSADQELHGGTNKLIQDCAAKLVTSADDILRELEDKITYYRNELEGKIAKVDVELYGEPIKKDAPIEMKSASFPLIDDQETNDTQKPKAERERKPSLPDNLNENEKKVLNALSSEPVHIDALCRDLGWTVAQTSATLGLLEFKDYIERESGMRFRLKDA